MTDKDMSAFKSELILRQIEEEDIEEIVEMAQKGFANPDIAFDADSYKSHIKRFPEGQVCIEYNGKIVGSASSVIINYDEYGDDHSFSEVSGNGHIGNHDPDGLTLYGLDVVVHPDYRHLKIGRRLYEARRDICKKFNLKNIIFGGRIPNYHKYADQMSPLEYAKKVERQEIYDPVIIFQLMNGFKLMGIKEGYLPNDKASLENATLMKWENPDYVPKNIIHERSSNPVGISVIQYKLREVTDVDDFYNHIEYFIQSSSKRRMNFVLFPEAIVWELATLTKERVPRNQIEKIVKYNDQYIEFLKNQAIKYSINIVAGSQYVEENGSIYNVSYLLHRDGKIDKQYKMHITSNERQWLGVQPGQGVSVFDTDCGKVAILIGYDIQFPELARKAVDQGAKVIFTPFTAQDEQEYLRMRYCVQARAIENQIYTVLSGVVGNLPNVPHLVNQYAKSGIFSPIDVSFSDGGIVRESKANTEEILSAEVDLEKIRRHRLVGTDTHLKDRLK